MSALAPIRKVGLLCPKTTKRASNQQYETKKAQKITLLSAFNTLIFKQSTGILRDYYTGTFLPP